VLEPVEVVKVYTPKKKKKGERGLGFGPLPGEEDNNAEARLTPETKA